MIVLVRPIVAEWGRTEVGVTDVLVVGNEPYACTLLSRPRLARLLVIDGIRFRNFGRTVAIPTQIETGFNFCAVAPAVPWLPR